MAAKRVESLHRLDRWPVWKIIAEASAKNRHAGLVVADKIATANFITYPSLRPVSWTPPKLHPDFLHGLLPPPY